MKNNISKKLRLLSYIAVAVLCITGCTEDNDPIPVETTTQTLKGYAYHNYGQLQKSKRLETLVAKVTSRNESLRKSGNVVDAYIIDTNLVQILEAENYTNYTFRAAKQPYDPNTAYNYVLTLFNDGSFHQMYVAYPILADGNYDIANLIGFPIDGDALVQKSGACGPLHEGRVWREDSTNCIPVNCTAGGDHTPAQTSSCNGDAHQLPRTICSGVWVTICEPGPPGAGSTGNGTITNSNGSRGGSTIAVTPINSAIEPLLLYSTLRIPHGSDLFKWIVDFKNKEQVDILFHLGEENQWSEDIRSFNLEALNLLRTGNETEKKLVKDVLKAIKGDISADLAQYLNPNAQPTEIGPASFCESGNWDPGSDPEMLYAYGPGLFRTFSDAAWNILIRGFEHFTNDSVEGDLIRDVFRLRGIHVPIDIPNETLGEMFQVFSDNGEFQVRYESGIGGDLLHLGLDILDVVTILSPSRGGGAFLAIKGGGPITVATFKKFLKEAGIGKKRIDDLVDTLDDNATFVLDGTGEFRIVRGHHPLAKIAFDGDSFYDIQKAFSVSPSTLQNVWENCTPIRGFNKCTSKNNWTTKQLI